MELWRAKYHISTLRKPFSLHADNSGFSLLELLIAGLLVAMISVMIYSVLNVGIKFTHKGEEKLLSLAREQGFLSLIHQQINGTFYDRQNKKMHIRSEDDLFTMITNRPLFSRGTGVVLAIYLYDSGEETVFYTEKVDFYNPEYDEDYTPERDEMFPLMTTKDFLIEYDDETGEVFVQYEGEEYIFKPKCYPQQA